MVYPGTTRSMIALLVDGLEHEIGDDCGCHMSATPLKEVMRGVKLTQKTHAEDRLVYASAQHF